MMITTENKNKIKKARKTVKPYKQIKKVNNNKKTF